MYCHSSDDIFRKRKMKSTSQEVALGVLGISPASFESRRDKGMLQLFRDVIKSKTNGLNKKDSIHTNKKKFYDEKPKTTQDERMEIGSAWRFWGPLDRKQ